MSIFTVALVFHVVSGVLALVSLPVPAFTRKGSRLHRRAGWVFVLAIGAGAASSLVLSAVRLTDGIPGNDAGAIFLAFVALLTGTTTWFGLRALRGRLARRALVDLALPVLLGASGLAFGAFAWHQRSVLYAFFALGGVVLAGQLLAVWRRPPASGLESLLLHVSGLGGACIATVTAVVVVNAGRLGLASVPLLPWIAPGMVGAVLIAGAKGRLRRRMRPGARREDGALSAT